jgi:hypothetical protein
MSPSSADPARMSAIVNVTVIYLSRRAAPEPDASRFRSMTSPRNERPSGEMPQRHAFDSGGAPSTVQSHADRTAARRFPERDGCVR